MSHIEEARRLVAVLKQRREEFVATKLPFVVWKEDYLLDAAKDALRDWAVGGIECLLATIDAQAAEIDIQRETSDRKIEDLRLYAQDLEDAVRSHTAEVSRQESEIDCLRAQIAAMTASHRGRP